MFKVGDKVLTTRVTRWFDKNTECDVYNISDSGLIQVYPGGVHHPPTWFRPVPPTVDSMPPAPAPTLAMRFDEGKAPLEYVLMFGAALREFAKVCEYGGKKYKKGNFMKGAPTSQSINCLLRHLLAWQEGEDRDPESNCLHLAHVVWNALRACQESIVRPDLDDRISYQKVQGPK